MELQVARLMGNYIFLSDAIPVQTESALLRVLRGGEGKFYSLGEDVSCLFFKNAQTAEEVSPVDALNSLLSHMRLTGKVFPPGYNQVLTSLHAIFESRKEGQGGRWFKAPGESQAEAFMRRLKIDDPSRAIYEAYVAELDSRWATATEVPRDRVLQMVKAKQVRYQLESAEFETLANSLCENLGASVKEATAEIEKRPNLTGLLTDGSLVAVTAEAAVSDQGGVLAAIKAFESEKERFAELVLSQKIPALDQRRK